MLQADRFGHSAQNLQTPLLQRLGFKYRPALGLDGGHIHLRNTTGLYIGHPFSDVSAFNAIKLDVCTDW